MTQPAKSHEPSMEEILASIRRIIADDDVKPEASAAPAAPFMLLFLGALQLVTAVLVANAQAVFLLLRDGFVLGIKNVGRHFPRRRRCLLVRSRHHVRDRDRGGDAHDHHHHENFDQCKTTPHDNIACKSYFFESTTVTCACPKPG